MSVGQVRLLIDLCVLYLLVAGFVTCSLSVDFPLIARLRACLTFAACCLLLVAYPLLTLMYFFTVWFIAVYHVTYWLTYLHFHPHTNVLRFIFDTVITCCFMLVRGSYLFNRWVVHLLENASPYSRLLTLSLTYLLTYHL